MHCTSLVRAACAALCLLLAVGAQAQDAARPEPKHGREDFARRLAANPPQRVAPPPIEPIPLAATGSPDSAIWESMFGMTTVRNVTRPALYPVLPAKGKANGTALVIAPGGGFLSLSFDAEGLLAARYLAERGIACFVLAYRLDPTPADTGAYLAAVGRRMGALVPHSTGPAVKDDGAQALAQDDGLAAIRYLRAHAADFGLAPERIGMLGFSAGARTTVNVATAYDAASRPDFIAVMYGASTGRPVPKDAPPAFVALAADDPLAGHAGVPIFEQWRAAGKPVELHIYAAGEHGFGMRKTGTSADNWIGHFYQWLQASKLVPQS